MQTIVQAIPRQIRPVRAVQFGAGVFLRGFADWMLEELCERCGWDGSIAVVKSTSRPGAEALREQGGRYTVALRGLAHGAPVEEFHTVQVIDRVLSASQEYAQYAALALCPTLRFVLSNTTEAGIAPDDGDETVRHRLEVYHEETEPLKSFYEARGVLDLVPGDLGTIEETTAAIMKVLEA